jgi:hypothetical protein
MWDKEGIQRLLAENDKAVVRAVAAIYARQTASEQSTESTVESNGVGFNYADARLGTYYGQYIARRGALTGHHLQKARRMMMKYWRQLAEIANAKQPTVVEPKIEAAGFRPIEPDEDVGNYLEEKMIHDEMAAAGMLETTTPRPADWA